MKKDGILAMIAMVLVITMSVPKVLAAAVPDAAGKASEGASVTSEQTAEQPPEKEAEGEEDAGEAKEPAGTENVGEAKEAKNSLIKNANFTGGGGTGISVSPIGFLIVGKDGRVELLTVDNPGTGDSIDKLVSVIERSPEIISKVKDVFSKK
jgi:hypothetical protein